MSWLLLITPGLPLLAALLLYVFRRIPFLPLLVLTIIPAVVLVLSGGYSNISYYPDILFGLRLGIDMVSQVFLLFTTVLWGVSGLYAYYFLRKEVTRKRFFFFHLLCMSGNIGVILSQDIPGFYMFFALMSIAAYGLVVHDGTPAALRAGRVYIVMAIIGEALIAMGLFLIADAAGSIDLAGAGAAAAASGHRDIIIALILAGFGIKTGLLTLHMWLPLAYTAGPVPASAILSGSMINAGLLGWIRFLPLGEASLQEWGWLCIAAGLCGAFWGVFVGMFQDNRKTILAYSSISQMGIITAGVGAGLLRAEAWPVVLTAILIYAFHHALAKGALFLSTGLTGALKKKSLRIPVFIGILLPALALSGAPFTSGVFAKSALKQSLAYLPPWAASDIGFILQAAAAATTLLMARFIIVMIRDAGDKEDLPSRGMLIPWAVLLIFTLLIFSPLAIQYLPVDAGPFAELTFSFYGFKTAILPVLAGGMAYLAFTGLRRITSLRFSIPPGDLLEIIVRLAGHLKNLADIIAARLSAGSRMKLSDLRIPDKWLEGFDNLENKLVTGTTGLLFFLLVAAGLLIMIFGIRA
ncbi:MAG: hypothetical protein IT392_03010 [Nitrospirae bacterium]|nr:hypothetical protein [Nitrospirota bacterium]